MTKHSFGIALLRRRQHGVAKLDCGSTRRTPGQAKLRCCVGEGVQRRGPGSSFDFVTRQVKFGMLESDDGDPAGIRGIRVRQARSAERHALDAN